MLPQWTYCSAAMEHSSRCSFHLPRLSTTLPTFPLTVRRDLLSTSLALRQTVDYVHAALRMRRPDEAEKLLLFQRCLPALMDSRVCISTAQTRVSFVERQAFTALRKGDADLDYGFSRIMEKASLCRVCPAMRSRPRSLAGQGGSLESQGDAQSVLPLLRRRPWKPYTTLPCWLWRGVGGRWRRRNKCRSSCGSRPL